MAEKQSVVRHRLVCQVIYTPEGLCTSLSCSEMYDGLTFDVLKRVRGNVNVSMVTVERISHKDGRTEFLGTIYYREGDPVETAVVTGPAMAELTALAAVRQYLRAKLEK